VVKIQSVPVSKDYGMKTYKESGGQAPHFFNFGTG